MNHDSAVIITGDGEILLDLNDARLSAAQLRSIRTKVGGVIDVLALQGAGASWYPMCYDYPQERQRELSGRKRIAKFNYLERTLTTVEPITAIPFAGPPCFLDPDLTWVNTEMQDGIFPDQQQVIDWLAEREIKNTVLLLPGDAFNITERKKEADPIWSEFSFSDRNSYLQNYALAKATDIAALKARYPEPTHSLLIWKLENALTGNVNYSIVKQLKSFRHNNLTKPMDKPILLSTPHMGDRELEFVKEAFDTNWIAPVGPHIDAFEQEFCQVIGASHAAAVSSGTAAIHLALGLVGIQPGDEVFCSSLTFVATANPITYLGAKPVFIDCDRISWNMNPGLLSAALQHRAKIGKLPKAVVVVHLYGQSADLDPILEACDRYEISLIEDAAESLGATYKGRSPGTFGRIGIYSFNGNKIITTSGGGMLVSNDEQLVSQARFLATQARDRAPHYQHSEIGYNYRLSNVLAGIGRGQLRVLSERVAARRRNFNIYQKALGKLPGIEFMPEASFGQATRWLTCLTIDPETFGADREQVCLALAEQQIESRRVWKPLHLQPVFANCEYVGGAVSEDLFARGLCLPSGSNLTIDDLERVIHAIYAVHHNHRKNHSSLFTVS